MDGGPDTGGDTDADSGAPDTVTDAGHDTGPDSAADGGDCKQSPCCAVDNGGCDKQVSCRDANEGVVCGKCPPGFDDIHDDGTLCVDPNQCEKNLDDCDDEPQACVNKSPGYECKCPAGYTGTGRGKDGCADIDECAAGSDDCDDTPQACVNDSGSYHCACPAGYTGTGKGDSCQDIDECAQPNTCNTDFPCVQSAPPGYVCRGQFADWPMPDTADNARTAPSYTLSTDTVFDNVTTLVWQRNLPATYPGCTITRATAGDACTATEAANYCAALDYAGRSDWRLPSWIELWSIVDYGTPTIDHFAFPNTPADYYVSSTPRVASTSPSRIVSGVRTVDMGCSSACSSDNGHVRCVAGGAATVAATVHYTVDTANGTVRDNRTHLLWRRVAPFITWAAANTLCAGLDVAGKTNWRLPTRKELLTLVDPNSNSPALDKVTFPELGGYTWASDAVGGAGSLEGVSFSGASNTFATTSTSFSASACCVHSD